MRISTIGAIGIAATLMIATAAPASADGLFAGISASPNGLFAGVGLGAGVPGGGYTTYQAVPLPYVPAAAVRYNRPCSVSDGFRTVAVPCYQAAAVTVGVQYVPVYQAAMPVAAEAAVDYPTYPRYRRAGWRRFHHHHHVLRRLY